MKIGQRIGKPIRVDQATSTGARLDYARVCVQVDLTKPLLSMFKINGVKYFIQYEGLEKICLECGRYCDRAQCTCRVSSEYMETDKGSAADKPKQAEPETPYGDWMIAKRKNRTNRKDSNSQSGKGQPKPMEGAPESPKGSRYNVLQDDDELVEDLNSSSEAPEKPPSTAKATSKGKSKEVEPRQPAALKTKAVFVEPAQEVEKQDGQMHREIQQQKGHESSGKKGLTFTGKQQASQLQNQNSCPLAHADSHHRVKRPMQSTYNRGMESV
ncbi:unnamed protein product [Linum tenue]|nr:unnamed protein product [Linum tenue]